ncbi:ribosomal protein S30 [Decorospora gaudefroyi]|uniref:Ribosomal protein S30 n=1 Tax=Decorospora gaudefroyi TaxID=184978 RepID=A0A6A5KJF5_9PLEO|nr:ribosomal protein S30 [Decorospora gaudefroyi]
MGKVHGSLARAGKVKSQTPKVRTPTSPARLPRPIAICCNTLPGWKWAASFSRRGRVEPQEKKKTPKGRAKKRLTYTRRFVNVTMTGGKRKMNPNPTS